MQSGCRIQLIAARGTSRISPRSDLEACQLFRYAGIILANLCLLRLLCDKLRITCFYRGEKNIHKLSLRLVQYVHNTLKAVCARNCMSFCARR